MIKIQVALLVIDSFRFAKNAFCVAVYIMVLLNMKQRGSQKQQSQDWIILRQSGNLGFGRNLMSKVACGEQLRLYVKNGSVFKDGISVGWGL